MKTVLIKVGSYHNRPVVNKTFELIKPYKVGKNGGFVTVKPSGSMSYIERDTIRIKVDNKSCFEYVGADFILDEETLEDIPFVPESTETDDEAMARIAERFGMLDDIAAATARGHIRAVIVTGPPGVGKSHGVLEQMKKESLFDKIKGNPPRYEVVKGSISGIGLFALLYKFSDPGNVVIFDDCDVWGDPDALNILKAALDSGKTRRISWNKDSRLLKDEGVPNSYDFHGSVMFITNVDVANNSKRSTIKAHINALQSRAHYLDLSINSERDKILRIKQVHRDAKDGLFADYTFDTSVGESIIQYMEENKDRIRELSLRMAVKIADLAQMSPSRWKTFANSTCLIGE